MTPAAAKTGKYADTPESAVSEEDSSVDQSFQSAVDRSQVCVLLGIIRREN